MFENARAHFVEVLRQIDAAGLTKRERVIDSAQGPRVLVDGKEVLNFCANNYLGLSSHPTVVAAAQRALSARGFGMSSVRFICGTQDGHRELERRLSAFLGTQDTILYSSCFDANGGLFETLLGPEDAVISDALNHASIIDGVRLCKARRSVFRHDDLDDLELKLKEAADARHRMIATDGVFSMDGDIARVDRICDLAERHRAMVMVDDSHATGFIGPKGRGTPELHRCVERVDLVTSTLGKALGGAAGGLTSGRAELIALLRNRSRPYLFSNALPPPVVAASLAVLDLLEADDSLPRRLRTNTLDFRSRMTQAGFSIRHGVTDQHPICPIMLGEAGLASRFADRLLQRGVYVIGFSFPVVPQGQARIRVQVSAGHTPEHIEAAAAAFAEVGRELGVV